MDLAKQYHIFKFRSLFATFKSLKSAVFSMHAVVQNLNSNCSYIVASYISFIL